MVEEKLKMKTSLEELQEEFDAFRESSAELEQELERELERLEGQARRSDARLRNAEDTKKEITGKLTRELLQCQREVAMLRAARQTTLSAVRDQEEALEQSTEKERRAQAEAEALRGALDASMEIASFTQTEMEEIKRASEEKTRQLYEDLKDVRSELALFTPIKAEYPMGSNFGDVTGDGASGRRCCIINSSSSSGKGRSRTRFFTMASLDEEDLWEGKEGGSSLDGYGTPSANEYDEDSPILVSASAGDAAGLGEPFGVDDGAYGALGWNRVKGEEAVDLKEQNTLTTRQRELERQLSLSATFSQSDCKHSTVTINSRGSTAKSVSSCSSCRTITVRPSPQPHHPGDHGLGCIVNRKEIEEQRWTCNRLDGMFDVLSKWRPFACCQSFQRH